MPNHPDDNKTTQLDLKVYVPALVTFLANKLSSGASNCYRKHFNIGVVEWRILALLRVERSITANRICQVIGLDKAAVSRALKSLHKRELVLFAKDEQDGCASSGAEIRCQTIAGSLVEGPASPVGEWQLASAEDSI